MKLDGVSRDLCGNIQITVNLGVKTCEECPNLYVDYYYDTEKQDECPAYICELDTELHIDTKTMHVPRNCPLKKAKQ